MVFDETDQLFLVGEVSAKMEPDILLRLMYMCQWQHFRAVAQRKGALLLTVAAQALILPALGFGLAHVMALPLFAGMALRRVRPGFVERHGNTAHRLVLAGIACLLAHIIVTQFERLAAEWQQTAIAAAVFMVLALAAGLAVAFL